MKQNEIAVGKCYGNGKGQIREVLLINRPSNLFAWEVTYLIRKGALPGQLTKRTITRQSFAAWAKEEVEER